MIQWKRSVTEIGRERSVIKVAWVDETGEPDEFTGYVDDYLRNRMNRVGASDGEKRAHRKRLELWRQIGGVENLEVEAKWLCELDKNMQVTILVPRNESEEELAARRRLRKAVRRVYKSELGCRFLDEMSSPPSAKSLRVDEMLGLFESLGVKDTDRNREKYRLWEELNPLDLLKRKCPYSGAIISAEDVFLKGCCEVDHIVPKDDGGTSRLENLVLCTRDANIVKGHRTPWVAWGGVRWNAIKEWTAHLPPGKRAIILVEM